MSITVGVHMIILNIITFSCSGNFNLIFTLYLLHYIKYKCMYLYELEYIKKKVFLKKFSLDLNLNQVGWDPDSEIHNIMIGKIYSFVLKNL